MLNSSYYTMRRIIYYISVLLFSLLVLCGIVIGALTSDKVQTAIVQFTTDNLSRGLDARVSVGNIEHHFPARLRLDRVCVEDQQGDTLIYIDEIYAHFRPMALLRNQVRFSRIDIRGARGHVYTLPDGEYNYAFLMRAFRSDTESTSPTSLQVAVRDIHLQDIQLRWMDYDAWLDVADMDLHHFAADSISAEVRRLSANVIHDGHRFTVNSLQAQVQRTDSTLRLPLLCLELPQTRIDLSGASMSMPASTRYTPEALAKARFMLPMHTVRIHPADLAMWIPTLSTLDGQIVLGGTLSGTLDDIRAHQLTLDYDNDRMLSANVRLRNATDINRAYLDLVCDQCHISAARIEQLATDYANTPVSIPLPVHRLGDIRWRGELHGQLHNLSLIGAITTDCGNLTIDGNLVSNNDFSRLEYRIKGATRHFQLGRMLDNSDVNELSLDITSSGTINGDRPDIDIDARLIDFSLKGYTYRSIAARGHLSHRKYSGMLRIDDPNADIRFDGTVSLEDVAPVIDCRLAVRHLRPAKLNLYTEVPGLEATAITRIKGSGTDLDHMQGDIHIDSVRITDGHRTIAMQRIGLSVRADAARHKQLRLTSDYLTAELSGHFAYPELPGALMRVARRHFPSMLPDKVARMADAPHQGLCDAQLRVDGHRLSDLLRLFGLRLPINDDPHLAASFNEATGRYSVLARSDKMRYKGRNIRDIYLSLDNMSGPTRLEATAAAMGYRGSILATMWGDTVHSTLQIRDLTGTAPIDIPDIHLDARMNYYKGKPRIYGRIAPTYINWNDTAFHLDETRLTYCVADTMLTINNMSLYTRSNSQRISLSGSVSPRSSDALHISLYNINAGYLMPFVVDPASFKLTGFVSGECTASSLMRRPIIEGDVSIRELGMGDELLGDATGSIRLDSPNSRLLIEAHVRDSVEERALLTGDISLSSSDWALDITPNHFPLGFINYWTGGILDDIQGHVSGHVRVFGHDADTYVLAQAHTEHASFGTPFTGVRYYLDDQDVVMDSTSIRFEHCTVTDIEGNPMRLNGVIRHHNFSNFRFDIQAEPQGTLVLDQPNQTEDGLQGRVYARGQARILGDEHAIDITANVETANKSQFRFSIATASSAQESNFIHFVNVSDSTRRAQAEARHKEQLRQEAEAEAERLRQQQIWYGDRDVINTEDTLAHTDTVCLQDHIAEALQNLHPGTRIKVALNIDINTQAQVQLLLDDRTGDMISARGEGALSFTYDSQTNDISLMGNYLVQSGSLGFTLGNVIRREFAIGPGSEITFSGKPENPQLNVRAAYRVVASLRDLFGDEVNQIGVDRTHVPVNTWLQLSGTLNAPVISFAIELPSSEEAIQNQVRSVINTDEMLMRQVVYLLVFGRFYTPEYIANSEYAGINETYSLLSSTVTGQINSWLSKLTDVFTMGLNIRTDGEGSNSSYEYEAQFQLQPVDRLIINGNVGYRYNDISNRPFFGDLDVEVLLTNDGQLRLKGYTHTVDKYSLRQANTIQGISLLWRYNFNWPTPEQLRQQAAQRRARREAKKAQKTQKTQKTN